MAANGVDAEADVKLDGASADAAARQLLGMKGASGETNKWKIRLQLMKPVTWIPLIWGVSCGAAASGQYHWNNPMDIGKAALCMFLAGPLLTGYTQVINDWYDREIDAINEPYRPIPSGLITEEDVKVQVAVLLTSGFLVSGALDYWAGHDWPVNVALTTFGVFIAYIYSAPPLKLKQNGWTGSYALGASYIALPWWAGQALFGSLDWKTMVLTMFYSLAGLGIAIINDFKSVEGDRATGMQSLPVMFGIDTAKWITVGTIDVFQLLVAAILFAADEKTYAAAIVALVAPQIYLQATTFLKDPVAVSAVEWCGLLCGPLVAAL
jgi:chlorophyll/bacteriochlorophyll a synthase